MPMTDDEFNIQASVFLAQLTPEQRADLSERALKFGKKADAGAGAQDPRPMAKDSRGFNDPDAGKSFDERFPHANRLTGGTLHERFPNLSRLKGGY